MDIGRPSFLLILTALIWLVTAPSAIGEDWPKWLGPRGDGSVVGIAVPDRWPAGGPKVVWKRPIGGGYSGVVVAGDRVIVLDRPAKTDRSKTPDGHERITCFRASTGDTLWTHQYGANYGDLDYGNGPRATATIFQGRVFTLGAVGMALCLDLETGKPLWAKDTVKEFGARVPMWGFAASPVLDGERVFLHVGAKDNGSIIALDPVTGAELWRGAPDPAGYATPILIDAPHGRVLVAWTPLNVRGFDPKTGAILWTIPYEVTYGVSIATPIYRDGLVFVTGYWEGAKAIKLGNSPSDAKLAWEDRRNLRGLMAPPLYRDGYVFSLDKDRGITCFELASGRKLWDDRNRLTPKGRNPQASFFWLDGADRVLALNSDGELILARFRPSGYKELSRAKVIGPTWASPGFVGHHLIARSDSELVCVDLADPK